VRDFVARFNSTWEQLTPDTYRYEDLGERVLTLSHMRGRGRDGIEVVLEMGHVWTFRDGLIVRMDAFADPRKALEAVGLSE
jgi:ketosteroid isomerase-like protein